MGKFISGDFFKDVLRLLGWGYKKGRNRLKNKKDHGFLSWLSEQMRREM